MFRLFSILVLLLLTNHLVAQEILSSAGTTMEGESTQISWTIGEVITATIQNESKQLSQGFHQPDFLSTSLEIILSLQGRNNIDGEYSVRLFKVDNTDQPFYDFNPTVSAETSIRLITLLPGQYKLAVRRNLYLQKIVDVDLPLGGYTIDLGVLCAGDANNDNFISILDFSILSSSFNLTSDQPGFDPRADFNGDLFISILDFSLLSGNYNKVGDFIEP